MATSVVGELAVWNDTAQTQVTNARLPFYLVAATGAPAAVRRAAPYACDGTADQTEIEAAIDAANAAGGGTVLLTEGTFTVTAPITLKSNVRLVGMGDTTVIALANATNTPVIDNAASADTIAVRDLTIDGNVANQTNDGTYNKHALKLNTATNVLIDRVTVVNSGTDGMNFVDVPGIKVHRCRIDTTYNHGITFQNCDYAWFIENEISNCGSTTDALGFTDSGMGIIGVNVASDYVQMRGNLVSDIGDSGLRNERNGVGWVIADNTVLRTGKDSIKIMGVVSSDLYAEKNVVANNVVIAAGNDGILALGDNNVLTGNFIYLTGQNSNVTKRVSGNGINLSNDGSGCLAEGNWILDAFLHGINAVGGAGHVIRGNVVSRSNQNGIYLTNCTRATVEGNTTKNNSQENDDTYAGIRVDHSSGDALSHIVIRHNRSYDDQGSATQRWGIRLEGTTNVTDSQVTDNDLWGNIGGSISNSWTGARNLVASGTPTVAISDFGEDGFYVKDYFLFNTSSNVVGELGWNRGGSGTGAVNFAVSISGDPGGLRLDTGATAGGLSYVRGAATTSGNFLAAEKFEITWRVRLNANDTDTAVRFGIGADGAATPPNNGVYVEKAAADTEWFGVCRSSSTESRTAALAANDTGLHTFKIRRRDASAIAFSIDDGAELTLTTNIPTAGLTPFANIVSSGAGGSKTVDLRFFAMRVTGLSR